MLNAQDVKLKLTEIHIIKILEKLGAIIFQNTDIYINSTTVCHHGTSSKLYYYKESQQFHCYTDCGDNFDILELICRSKRISLREAINWICVLFNFDSNDYGFGKSGSHLINDWDFINTLPKKKKKVELIKKDYYDKRILNIFQNIFCKEWIDEGISIDSMLKFGIKYSTLQQKIIIPHYSINDELIGIRGRTMLEDDLIYGKYMPYTHNKVTYAHPLSQNLYGLNINKNNIIKKKKIMIVESEKSVLQCDTMFGEDNFTVALCGSGAISDFQKNLILSLGVNEVIIGLDKQYKTIDDEEEKYWSKHIRKKIIAPIAPYVRVSVLYDTEDLLDYKMSPSDNGLETLLKLMDNKIYVPTL